MVLNDILNSRNQKRELIKKIMSETKTTESTVYRWLQGKLTPPPVKQEIIAKILNVPVKELFP